MLWVVNDTGVSVNCSGLLGNLKTAYGRRKLSCQRNGFGKVCLQQMQLAMHCFHFSVVRTGEKYE